MKIEIGDKVRFLNDVGSGIVTKIEGALVFVNDEDDFEVPIPIYEAVLVEKASGQKPEDKASAKNIANEIPVQEEQEIFEDESNDDFNPKAYLAFITASRVIDEKSKLHVYLINDSNYFCSYFISRHDDSGHLNLLYQGVIEPNFKMMLGEKEVTQLDADWEIQMILYKKDKPYPALSPISTSVKLSSNRFFKPNAFKANDFFYQSAVLISIIKDEFEKKLALLTNKEIHSNILEKDAKPEPKKAHTKRADTKELLEIDLHIHELLDDIRGLSNTEMLNIQLDRFNSVMTANKGNKGRKIVFIHGVGNGTLKTELIRQLDRKYKGTYYQDASFKEYGFGATMVIM